MKKKTNRSYLFTILALLGILATSCAKDDDSEKRAKEKRLIENYLQITNITATPTTSGMYIIPVVEGTGATPSDGQFALIQYKATDLDGTFVDGTDKALAEQKKVNPTFALGGPLKFHVGVGGWLPGVIEGLKTMKEGGKTKMIMPSLLAYNDYIPRIFEVELIKVIPNPMAYEKQQIANFLDTATEIGIADSIASGVYYIQRLAGTGSVKPFTGQTVSVKYTGYLPDGRIFDKSANDTVFKFTVGGTGGAGGTRVINGLDEGIRLMTVGTKATILIPYYRGYGFNQFIPRYQIVIPYFSTLIFDVELKNIKD